MRKFLWVLLIAGIIIAIPSAYVGYKLLHTFNGANTDVKIRVRSSWTKDMLAAELGKSLKIDKDAESDFIAWSQRLGYEKVKACFLTIPSHASLYEIINLLKANRKQTRDIVIKGGWDAKTLAQAVADNIEVDADSFLNMLQMHDAGGATPPFDDTTWPAFFIPNTYNFYVSDNLGVFMKKMAAEKEKFWNAQRREKAAQQGLDEYQVAIIASIVSKESNKTDEYENIAGVYINRFRKNMLLQADPTVVYARKKGGRVLGADLKIPSPYNTYIHKGLPPGPICIPGVAAYDAVLNYTHHDYLYFCAKADFSGYHNFASTWEAHLVNARAFHKALDARK